MLTKEQALTANEFHVGQCSRRVGKRGGIKDTIELWRRAGKTQTWVTRPEAFRVPVKYGLYGTGSITDVNADTVHVAEDCPLRVKA